MAPISGVLLVSLRQAGIDLRLEIGPYPAVEATSFESETGRDGEELAVLDVTHGTTYELRITSNAPAGVQGSYQIDVEVAAAVPLGLRLYSDASKDPSTNFNERAAIYDKAARALEAHGLLRRAGLARLASARNLYLYESDFLRTAEAAQSAVELFEQADEPLLLAKAVETKAAALLDSHDRSPELDAQIFSGFTRSQALYRERASEAGYAEIEIYKGLHAYVSGNRALAAQLWRSALAACIEAQEAVCEARATQNLGVLARDDGDYATALEQFAVALARIEPREDLGLHADINDNLAFALRSVGGYDEALHRHSAAALAYAEKGRCADVGRSLYGMAYSLLGIGDIDQAMRFYRLVLDDTCDQNLKDSLPARTKLTSFKATTVDSVGNMCRTGNMAGLNRDRRNNVLWTAWDLGNLLRSTGRAHEALECHNLALSLATSHNYRLGVRLEIAEDYLSLSQEREAEVILREVEPAFADERSRSQGRDWYHSRALELGGVLELRRDAPDRAIELFRRALEIHERLRNQEGRFESLRRMAETYARSKQSKQAHAHFLQADGVLEEIRTSSLDPVFRASLFDARREMYANWLDALRPGGGTPGESQNASALELLAVSERSRSRTLIQLISDHTESMELRAFKRTQLPASARVARFLNSTSAEELRSAIRAHFKNAENNSTDADLAQTKQRIAGQHDIGSAALRLADHQRQIPSSVAIVEYLLGAERSTAWIVRRETVRMINLAPANKIRSAVKSAASALAAQEDDQFALHALGELHDLIVGPLRAEIGESDLIIVPDDALYGVPFAALWNTRDRRFLIEERTVSMIPSIQFMFSGAVQKPPAIEAASALIVGDPVYEAQDATIRCGKGGDRVGHTRLPRLRHSGLEAAKVAGLFEQVSASSVTSLLACDASRSAVLRQPLSEFTHLHFAAHASVDSLVPHNSAIHLSGDADSGSMAACNLTVADLLNERLTAQLVVLSGCATAHGRAFRGDGVLGLSFAVLASGSKRVMSTLWPVADLPAAELVGSFYESLLLEGREPAAALRNAQLTLLRKSRWRAPKYWASYVITG